MGTIGQDATSAKTTLELSDIYRNSPLRVEFSRKAEEYSTIQSLPSVVTAKVGVAAAAAAGGTTPPYPYAIKSYLAEPSLLHYQQPPQPQQQHPYQEHFYQEQFEVPSIASSAAQYSHHQQQQQQQQQYAPSDSYSHSQSHTRSPSPYCPLPAYPGFDGLPMHHAPSFSRHPSPQTFAHRHLGLVQEKRQFLAPPPLSQMHHAVYKAPAPLSVIQQQQQQQQIHFSPIDAVAARPKGVPQNLRTGSYDVPAPLPETIKRLPTVPLLAAPHQPVPVPHIDTLRAKLLRRKVENGAHLRDVDNFVREALSTAVELSMGRYPFSYIRFGSKQTVLTIFIVDKRP